MFKDLRRQDRALSENEAGDLLKRGKFGVLSVMGENGYPYGVPIHYVMIDNSLYFHCTSSSSHKVNAIRKNAKICFTVIETEDGIKSKSAIFFGTANEVKEKRQMVLEKLVEKFVPEIAWKNAKQGIPYALDNILAFELNMDYLSGKWIDKPEGR